MEEVNSDLYQDELYYNELMNILRTRGINTVFQPIVSLSDGNIIGYEALSRTTQGSILNRPDLLFSTAKKYNKVWELELLCRIRAIQNSHCLPGDKKLFLNVDPGVIKDEHFKKGFTREFLMEYNVDPSSVIFEITERTAIEDYKNFKMILENYVNQGYKIAIDDTGSGYSGLKLLAETHPQYIKIDMDLIRDIDKDSFKQALLTSFLNFSEVTNMKIIAEGIETLDELSTLINIGIPYGQGYYLHRPAPSFTKLPDDIRNRICEISRRKSLRYFDNSKTEVIGNIIRHDNPIFPDTPCHNVKAMFEHSNIQGLVVVDEREKPIGLVMKNKFNERLATQYGVAVYMNRPVNLLMDKVPLIVDYNTPLITVSKAAMSRKESNLYDYIIITKDGEYAGVTTVKRLLEHTSNLELNYARHLSPLTGLPGNLLIEKEINNIIKSQEPYSVLYLDIDNFKAYNDAYGFENGDSIIKLTSSIIQSNLNSLGGGNSFLGHIGGDDFIACLYPTDKTGDLCKNVIRDFDMQVLNYYNDEDKQKGYITTINRHNAIENFPVMTISIAVITSTDRRFASIREISETAAWLKKKCKAIKKSCYMGLDGVCCP